MTDLGECSPDVDGVGSAVILGILLVGSLDGPGLGFLGDVGVEGGAGAGLVGEVLLPAADDEELLLESPELDLALTWMLGVDDSWTEFRNSASSHMFLAAINANWRSAFTSSLSVLGEFVSLMLVPWRKGSHSAFFLLFSAMYATLSMDPSSFSRHMLA